MEKKLQYTLKSIALVSICMLCSCGASDSVQGVSVRSDSHLAYTEGTDYGAVSGYESYVKIERPYSFRGYRIWTSQHTVTAARVGLGQLKLKWDDDHHLSVSC